MNPIIKAEIDKIRTTISSASNLSDDFLFTVVCHKFMNCDGKLDDESFEDTYVDGSGDGGIDLIFCDHDSEDEKLVLMQGKNTSLGTSKDVVQLFQKIALTIKDFEEGNLSNYSQKLKKVYTNSYDSMPEGFNTSMILYTTDELSSKKVEDIKREINKNKDLEIYDPIIFFEEDIVKRISEINDPKQYVEYDKLDILKIPNQESFIRYETKDEEGILCTASALSLRKLYNKHQGKGLFEQNFRELIYNKTVDGGINESLQKDRSRFWFYNNGVIIGCSDFDPEASVVRLSNFSIVNGCQTVSRIGKYSGPNENEDFGVVCKIVAPKHDNKEKTNKFIGTVAEASNSQKKIELRDLKSNTFEQRNLQKQLKLNDPKVYLEIKRGVSLLTAAQKKSKGVGKSGQPWRYLKNDEYGQFIGSFDFGRPDLRSQKKAIFADKKLYKELFISKDFDKECILDKLEIFHLFQTFKAMVKDEGIYDNDETKNDVVKYGQLHIPALLSVILKIHYGYIDWKTYKPEDLRKDHFEGKLLIEERPDEFDLIFQELFMDIIEKVGDVYESIGETSMTNFFKTSKTFSETIVKKVVIDRIFSKPLTKDKTTKLLNKIFVNK